MSGSVSPSLPFVLTLPILSFCFLSVRKNLNGTYFFREIHVLKFRLFMILDWPFSNQVLSIQQHRSMHYLCGQGSCRLHLPHLGGIENLLSRNHAQIDFLRDLNCLWVRFVARKLGCLLHACVRNLRHGMGWHSLDELNLPSICLRLLVPLVSLQRDVLRLDHHSWL